MRKQWLLAMTAIVATLALSLAVIRWFAPGLLGVPVDLQMVRTSKTVPPFFDNVFRDEDYRSSDFIIPDPFVKRAKPLYPDRGAAGGPHDILGFRNRVIPTSADIITIGDSQTYGNNVALAQNWPSQLANRWPDNPPRIYNMAVGGWGAVEYLEIFPKALYFKPRMIIVAFYSGNDPLESFIRAYSHERWEKLRPSAKLDAGDAPSVPFPPPESEWWAVRFPDGQTTTFTPSLRLASNRDHPVPEAGYEIMAVIARRMAELASQAGVRLVFTLIPTKELVYAAKVQGAALDAPAEYRELVARELENVTVLETAIREIDGPANVDLIVPLQAAAEVLGGLYPTNLNGHPLTTGYRLIAQAMVPAVIEMRQSDRAGKTPSGGRLTISGPVGAPMRSRSTIASSSSSRATTRAHSTWRTSSSGSAPPSPWSAPYRFSSHWPSAGPTTREVLYRLGEAERLRGNATDAAAWYERFLEAGGHQDLTQSARERLKEISE